MAPLGVEDRGHAGGRWQVGRYVIGEADEDDEVLERAGGEGRVDQAPSGYPLEAEPDVVVVVRVVVAELVAILCFGRL